MQIKYLIKLNTFVSVSILQRNRISMYFYSNLYIDRKHARTHTHRFISSNWFTGECRLAGLKSVGQAGRMETFREEWMLQSRGRISSSLGNLSVAREAFS